MTAIFPQTIMFCTAALVLPSVISFAQAEPKPISVRIINQRGQTQRENSNGNVEVTLSNRRREVWTRSTHCELAKVSKSGLVGWTYAAGQHSRGDWMNDELCIARSKHDRTHISTSRAFIEVWAFTDNDTHVVTRSRHYHGPSWIEKFDISTGKLIDECEGSNFLKDTPKWAQPWCDEADSHAEQPVDGKTPAATQAPP